jgi:KDO2-lipid IV(A) lauroyltransferase
MAKYYFIPRRWSKRFPDLHPIGWRIEAAFIRLLIGVLARRAPEAASRLARAVFRAIGPRTAKRKSVIRSLYVAFPERSDDELTEIRREVFGNLGVAMAEIVHLGTIWRERERRLEFVAHPDVRFIHAPGTPAVLVTAHVGPWTLTNFAAQHYGFPLTIVYAQESNPYVHDIMRELRNALGVNLVPRDKSMRTLLTELGAGRPVGLGSDVRLDAGEMVPFFGHEMLSNTVPARLALRFGCELVPVRAERLDGARFRITLCAPVRPAVPQAPLAEEAVAMTRKLNDVFEGWIREAPGEWVCLARRWPKEVLQAAAAGRREPMKQR